MSMVAATSERVLVRQEFLVRIFRSANNQDWYWNMTNKANNKIEGATSEGYGNKTDCIDNLWRVTGFEPDLIIDLGTDPGGDGGGLPS